MAKILHLLLVLFLSLLQRCVFSDESQGFSLNLVRREITNNDIFPNTIRPRITRSSYLYTIDASIGTPPRKRTFIFDTGSELTWTQCTPCVHCFKQDYPLFDPKTSTSYKRLTPSHALARFFQRSNNGECVFNMMYMSGESSSGIASVETFTFTSNKRGAESVKGVAFGCSNNHRGEISSNTAVTGIMGINRSPLSLISQMGTKSARRFSYCLPKLSSPVKSTFLRFGNDIKDRGSFQKTSFLTSGSDYNVRLLAISINGRQLSLPWGALSKGCVLDVGSGASNIEMGVYNVVLSVLREYFDRFNLTRVNDIPSPLGDLCYRVQQAFRSYPSMVLHFQGSNFEIGAANLFRFRDDYFCLGMLGRQGMSMTMLLGAYQQQNVRFVYDVGNGKLLFGKEDCSQDKA
ncbi:hypothetical protein ABFX02_13G057800 [Erythranthe guttata]